MTDAEPRQGTFAAAMDTLRSHQQDVREQLRAGFRSRQAILLWQHRCGALTIGRIRDGWYRSILNQRWDTAALLADHAARDRLCSDPPPNRLARKYRYDIIQNDLIPGFQEALSVARKLAIDYSETGDHAPVPERQRYIFMRPQLDDLYESQRDVLLWALGWTEEVEDRDPITGREDLIEWADATIYATNGLIEPGFAARVATPASEWWGPLMRSRGPTLELLLASQVLPEFNRALRDAAERAKESAIEERDERGPTPI